VDLADLLAKQAITEQIYRYCRGTDRMDYALTRSVWHEDGTVDFSMGLGVAGYPDMPPPIPVGLHLDWAWQARLRWDRTSHQATNILIDVSGASAVSETCSISVLRRSEGEDSHVSDLFWGRWLDRWSLRGERWAIDHRQAVTDTCSQILTPADLPANVVAAASRRDRQDPSYSYSDFA
jgi:hypothetical protein